VQARWALILLACVCAGSAAIVRADEIIERVLAVVAGDLIMLSDVRAARDLGFIDPGTAADPVREVLSRLIDRSLILAEVDRYAPPEPGSDDVDRGLATVRRRFATPDAFDAALAALGIDVNHVRQTIREDLRIRAYLEQRFTAEDPQQRRMMIDEWLAGLRRRADIIDLYVVR
jgi:hypothetical protein